MRIEAINSVVSVYPISPPQKVRKKKKVEDPAKKGEFQRLLMAMIEKRNKEEALWRESQKPIIISREKFVKEQLEMLKIQQNRLDYMIMCQRAQSKLLNRDKGNK